VLATPVDLHVAAVLRFVNDARARLALAPLDDLLAGVRLNPWFCPICASIADGAPRSLEPEFSGTRLRVWRRGTRLLHLEVDAPLVVVAWSERFDLGAHDAYATTRDALGRAS
jgi:hypothetical protein